MLHYLLCFSSYMLCSSLFIGFIVILLKYVPQEARLSWNQQIKSWQKIKRISDLPTLKCLGMLVETRVVLGLIFILRKPILQMRMRSHLVGLDVWFLVGLFFYFHISCVRVAKALARLRRCMYVCMNACMYVCMYHIACLWKYSNIYTYTNVSHIKYSLNTDMFLLSWHLSISTCEYQ